jgi:acyl-coenzyme A synthetase/AMP-(fatty) acid ligase
MPLEWLLERFGAHAGDDAVVWRDRTTRYGELLERIAAAQEFLEKEDVAAGEVVLLDADFSPESIAMLLAAIERRTIVVPVASHVVNLDREKYAAIAEASRMIELRPDVAPRARRTPHRVTHPLLERLRAAGDPGLVLFSSGSTGEPKASLHNLSLLLRKFQVGRHTQRIITFLLFDHIGGFNSMMYALAHHGCVITLEARDPASVCAAIEKHHAEVLPTSPTFLNLLLMSGEHRRHDLSSLKVISYATEVMPETTLQRLHQALPAVELRQSYGLSELGILRSRSRGSDSLWVRVGGEDYETRVVDHVLHIRSRTSMMGYLNAPSPFDAEGWFNTQDEVEVDGEWLRFKGRKSEIINVGGEKVYPAEVESVILEVDNVRDATVTKEPHPFTGNIVVAEVRLEHPEDAREVEGRIRRHCFSRLPSFKVPVKIFIGSRDRTTERFKKERRGEPAGDPGATRT